MIFRFSIQTKFSSDILCFVFFLFFFFFSCFLFFQSQGQDAHEAILLMDTLTKELGYQLFLLRDPWKYPHFNSAAALAPMLRKKWIKLYTM